MSEVSSNVLDVLIEAIAERVVEKMDGNRAIERAEAQLNQFDWFHGQSDLTKAQTAEWLRGSYQKSLDGYIKKGMPVIENASGSQPGYPWEAIAKWKAEGR
jgi:ABC-type transport system involved in cytochrome bd biosynthesis fused ATPase/permease subunit